MDITKYKFVTPEFRDPPTDNNLLDEARARGFDDRNNKYCGIFSKLFYEGGKLNFKQGLDPAFKESAVPYLRAFMQSFSPSHEVKMAISALILSELVD